MEHYQATNTPRVSSSHNLSTPPENKCNFNGMNETNLPQELSELCIHQCKVAQVPIKSHHPCSVRRSYFSMLSHYLLPFAASFLPKGNGSLAGDEG